MPSKTLTGHDFPDGTLVGAYPRENLANGGPPSGTAVDTSTVSGGSLTFDGLTEGRRYVAYAQGRAWSFFMEEGSLDQLRPIKGQEAQEIREGFDEAVALPGQVDAIESRVEVIEEGPLKPSYFDGTVQAVVDHIGTGGGEIYLEPGVYDEQVLLPSGDVTIRGVGWRKSRIVSASGDVVSLGVGSIGALVLENLSIESLAGGGNCVVQLGNLDQPRIRGVRFVQNNAAQHCWLTNNTGYLIDGLWEHCDFRRAAGASVPAVKWVSDNGECNKNMIGAGSRFTDLSSGTPTAPFIHWEEQSAGAKMGGNVLRDINAEIPRAGILRALSQHNLIVENVDTYDLTSATLADLFYVGASAVGGQVSRFPRIVNCHMIGTFGLGVGFYAVKFAAGQVDYPLWDGGDHTSLGGAYTVDLGPNTGAVVRGRNGPAIANMDTTTGGMLYARGSAHNQVGQLIVGGKRHIAHSSVPATGTWAVGDRCFNLAPVVGQPKGWVCTVAGTPGTWVSEGNL